MKLRALCVAALVLCVARAALALDWNAYRSLAGGFTVLLCGDANESAQEPLEGIISHFIAAKGGDITCVVSYTDFPEDYSLEPARQLIEARDGLVRGAGALLVTSRLFQYEIAPRQNVPALEIVAVRGPVSFRGNFAVVGKRLYSWTLIAPAEFTQGVEAERFLRSLRLVPAARGAP